MSLNANALTTLARLTALGLTQSNSILEAEINLVSELVEDYLTYSLGYSSETRLLQGSGTPDLLLPRAPVIAVSALSVAEVALIEADGDFSFPNDYRSLGKIYRETSWPIRASLRDELTGDLDPATIAYPIEITYTAGFWLPNEDQGEIPEGVSPLPERIKKAVDMAIYQNLSQSTGAAMTNNITVKKEKTAGGYEVEYADASTKKSTDWQTVFPDRTLFYLSKYLRRDTLIL